MPTSFVWLPHTFWLPLTFDLYWPYVTFCCHWHAAVSTLKSYCRFIMCIKSQKNSSLWPLTCWPTDVISYQGTLARALKASTHCVWCPSALWLSTSIHWLVNRHTYNIWEHIHTPKNVVSSPPQKVVKSTPCYCLTLRYPLIMSNNPHIVSLMPWGHGVGWQFKLPILTNRQRKPQLCLNPTVALNIICPHHPWRYENDILCQGVSISSDKTSINLENIYFHFQTC